MGNNLFQLAAMIGYARKHNLRYCIPKSTIAPNIWPNWFDYLSSDCEGHLKNPVYIKQAEHFYEAIPAPVDNVDYVMEGYWQSYKYFDFCIDEVRKVFGFDYSFRKYECAIHIRRGDYVTEFSDKHPAVTEQYLDLAIKKMMHLNQRKSYFIFFSDDPDWAENYAKSRFVTYYVSRNRTPMEDFKLMMGCGDFIISNSSYSWWAAYLNANTNKTVITPSEDNWFGPGNAHLDCSTLLPPDWHRINY